MLATVNFVIVRKSLKITGVRQWILESKAAAPSVCASSKGLGRACAIALAEEGVHVTLTARGAEALAKTAAEIRKMSPGVTVTEVVGDITTSTRAAKPRSRPVPTPDILINNAAGPPPGDFRNWTRDDWIKAIDANMLTPIELIKSTVDGMMARKFGRIINITSGAVKAPIDVLGLSNGARAGLTGFIAGIARKTVINNVTINGLLPGPFDTDRLRGMTKTEVREARHQRGPGSGRTRQAQPRRTLWRPGRIRAGLRVSLRRESRLHHRAEYPARRRILPGHVVASDFADAASSVGRGGVPLQPLHRRDPLVGPGQTECIKALGESSR